MIGYALSHWRGQQGLLRSTLLNGVVAYLVLVVVLTASDGLLKVYMGLSIFLVWMVWATVGIIRCAAKKLLDRTATRLSRLGGILAIAGVLCLALLSVKDLMSLGLF